MQCFKVNISFISIVKHSNPVDKPNIVNKPNTVIRPYMSLWGWGGGGGLYTGAHTWTTFWISGNQVFIVN